MFLELPFALDFPLVLVGMLISMALITTWFAVYYPVKSVNEKQIAVVLKSS